MEAEIDRLEAELSATSRRRTVPKGPIAAPGAPAVTRRAPDREAMNVEPSEVPPWTELPLDRDEAGSRTTLSSARRSRARPSADTLRTLAEIDALDEELRDPSPGA
jgi:hypothetical protein